MTNLSSPLILLHPDDNVFVLREDIETGQILNIDGQSVTAIAALIVGHKIARTDLKAGQKIYKYGAPIGSMTSNVLTGEHVHLHNMKSDYISTHTRKVTG